MPQNWFADGANRAWRAPGPLASGPGAAARAAGGAPTPAHRLLPGRPPGAAPRDRRPLYRARNPHRPGSTSWSPPAPGRLCRCSPARSWHRATGYWPRDPLTPARWKSSGSRQPCRVRCRSGRQPGRSARTARRPRLHDLDLSQPDRVGAAPLGGRALVQAAAAAGIPLTDEEVLSDPAFPGGAGAAAAGRLRRRRDLGRLAQ
jgi:hypothetical protein